MENGLKKQLLPAMCRKDSPLSVVCSNVYLDKLDKEWSIEDSAFTRYADDVY